MDSADRRFVTARDLTPAPAVVWAAFADPVALAAWWGPAGFSNRFEVFEFRPAGRWVFEMIGPDGQRYANRSRFVELVPAQRVVVRHESAPQFTLTVTLDAGPGGGTRLHWQQVFDDAAVARAVAAIVRPANEQNLDRLAARLAGA